MADGNELDVGVTGDSVLYEAGASDGVASFLLPQNGFSLESQRAWADGVATHLGALIRDNRILRSQLAMTSNQASQTDSLLSDFTYTLNPENVEPPEKPSKPDTEARLGTVTIRWNGMDAFGLPMGYGFSHLNVYAVKTSLLPASPNFDLNVTEGEGAAEGDPEPEDPTEDEEVIEPGPEPVEGEVPEEEIPTPPLDTAWPPSPVGMIASTGAAANFVLSDLEYNEEYTIWFIAVNTIGVQSPASDRAVASVVPLVNTDLIGRVLDGNNIILDSLNESLFTQELRERLGDMEDGIEDAQTSANGKNSVWYRPVGSPPPSTGNTVGDTWFVTDKDNSVREWNGAVWSDRPFGTDAIDNLAITNAKIGNLDAAKITTGFLAADRINAKTIGADKLMIGSSNNEAWDGNYTAWNTPAWANSPSGGPGSAWTTALVRPGMTISQMLKEHPPGTSTASLYAGMRQGTSVVGGENTERLMSVADRAGEKLVAYAHYYVDQAPPTGMTSLSTQVYFYNAAGQNFSNQNGGRVQRGDVKVGEWVRIGGTQLTVPEGALYAIIRPTVYHTNGTTALNGTTYYLGGEEMYWANAGELIVEGSILGDRIIGNSLHGDAIIGNSITGGKIDALTIEAGNIASNAITADKIEAGAITAQKITVGTLGGANMLTWSAPDNIPFVSSNGATIGGNNSSTRGAIAYATGGNGTDGTLAQCITLTGKMVSSGSNANAMSIAPGEHYSIRAEVGVYDLGGVTPTGSNVRAARIRTAQYTSTGAYIAGTTLYSPTITDLGYQRGQWLRLQIQAHADASSMTVWLEKAFWSGGSLAIMTATVNESITGVVIAGGAITAKIIEGESIATALTGQRTQLDSIGLRTFNSGGSETSRLAASTGSMTLTGNLLVQGAITTAVTGQRTQLDSIGLRSFNASNGETSRLSAASGGMNLTGTLTVGGNIRTAATGQRVQIDSSYIRGYGPDNTLTGTISPFYRAGGSGLGAYVDRGVSLTANGGGTIQTYRRVSNSNYAVINLSADNIALDGIITVSSDNIIGSGGLRVLYSSGGVYMHATQTANLSRHVSEQLSGIILQWQDYENGSAGAAYNFTFIPKNQAGRGGGFVAVLGAFDGLIGRKYLYLDQNRIRGHANNGTGFGLGFVLTAVYGV